MKKTVLYDNFNKPGYGAADYARKWTNAYGPGELGAGGTQTFAGGRERVTATPFRTSADTEVAGHLKYIAVSTKTFAVPQTGSITLSAKLTAATPGVVPNKTIRGTYTQSGRPYVARLLRSQQAGVVMNVVDFCTGQLFDWFLTSTRAAPLIERLPTNVTQNTANPTCPGATEVGRDKMYTQFIKEVPVKPGVAHRIRSPSPAKPAAHRR